jgi:hypothetical protein
MPSQIQAISPLVDRLMLLTEGSRCISGEEPDVELALLQQTLSCTETRKKEK